MTVHTSLIYIRRIHERIHPPLTLVQSKMQETYFSSFLFSSVVIMFISKQYMKSNTPFPPFASGKHSKIKPCKANPCKVDGYTQDPALSEYLNFSLTNTDTKPIHNIQSKTFHVIIGACNPLHKLRMGGESRKSGNALSFYLITYFH